MICPKCTEVKLSAEFPLRPGKGCTRPSLWCLECTIQGVGKGNKCPECESLLSLREKEVLVLQYSILAQEEHFPALPSPPKSPETQPTSPGKPSKFNIFSTSSKKQQTTSTDALPPQQTTGSIRVLLLEGSSCTVHMSPTTSVAWVQSVVAKSLHIPVIYQRLLFQGVVVKPVSSAGKQLTLQDFDISSGATLLCMRLLFTINRTSDLDHVVFNLIWGYPYKGRDFLDGSCLVFENSEYLYPINFGHRKDLVTGNALFHSGDVMSSHTGRQTINLSLRSLPKNISHLFFTLSAFSSKNLSCFRNPSITLCRQESPDKPLLEYVITHAGTSEAVIMCCLARSANDGEWSVVALGKPSQGNVGNYTSMHATITQLFQEGMFNCN